MPHDRVPCVHEMRVRARRSVTDRAHKREVGWLSARRISAGASRDLRHNSIGLLAGWDASASPECAALASPVDALLTAAGLGRLTRQGFGQLTLEQFLGLSMRVRDPRRGCWCACRVHSPIQTDLHARGRAAGCV